MTSSDMTRSEAYAVLELPVGADTDAIRTSYKRLAQKWFPEKHPKDKTEVVTNFRKITQAYKRLDSTSDRCPVAEDEAYEIYWNTLYPNARYKYEYHNDTYYSSDSDYSESSDDDITNFLYFLTRGADKARNYRRESYSDTNDNDNYCNNLTAEQREQYANELISEEEKNKIRSEKRRAKKQRRRERKRLEKESAVQEKKVKTQEKTQETLNSETSNAKQLKDKKKEPLPINETEENNSQVGRNSDGSRQFAIEGNNFASKGLYLEAVEQFSRAIHLNSTDFRFFGNRSFCYERSGEFEKALSDANTAISLAPDWPKGHFRQGIAYLSLKQYSKAEESFLKVLKLDSKCEDAKRELHHLKTYQLMEMGFSQSQCEQALMKSDNMQQALDSLLSGQIKDKPSIVQPPQQSNSKLVNGTESRPVEKQNNPMTNGLSHSATPTSLLSNISQDSSQKSLPSKSSDEDNSVKKSNKKRPPLLPIPQHHIDESQRQIMMNKLSLSSATMLDRKMNPHNPEGLTSLWVGNVLPDVPQEFLFKMFSQFGRLQSVRCMPEKFCAFINFYDTECAGKAMQELQGIECKGQHLLIKFPDRPITAQNISNLSASSKLVSQEQQPPPRLQPPQQQQQNTNRPTGPVNGNECYFWRTTGCQFGSNCRYVHIPANRGIDKKSWHK